MAGNRARGGKGSGWISGAAVLVVILASAKTASTVIWIILAVFLVAAVIGGIALAAGRNKAREIPRQRDPQPGGTSVERQERLKTEIRSRLASRGVIPPAVTQILPPERRTDQPFTRTTASAGPRRAPTPVQRRPVPSPPVEQDRAGAPGSEIDMSDAATRMRPGSEISFDDLGLTASPRALGRPGPGRAEGRTRRTDSSSSVPWGEPSQKPAPGSSAVTSSLASPSVLGSSLSSSSLFQSRTGSSLTRSSLGPSGADGASGDEPERTDDQWRPRDWSARQWTPPDYGAAGNR